MPQWSAIYDEQIQEIQRLSDGQGVVDAVRTECARTLEEFALLGDAPRHLCELRQLAVQDILYVRYPGANIPTEFMDAQTIVFDALKDKLSSIQAWEGTEYGRFFKKKLHSNCVLFNMKR